MPEVSRFFGIVVRMYFDDHAPPHFHAVYGTREARIAVGPIEVLDSDLPGRALSMVLEWAALHEKDILANWHRLQAGQPGSRIEPLG